MSLQRERTFILALLLILAAASWAVLIWQARMMKSMGMGLTMGMGAALFLAIWVVMMIAMMFPATATMNLAFARVQRDRPSSRRPAVSTWIFVGAYLLSGRSSACSRISARSQPRGWRGRSPGSC